MRVSAFRRFTRRFGSNEPVREGSSCVEQRPSAGPPGGVEVERIAADVVFVLVMVVAVLTIVMWIRE
jgi:hypothetical protein